MEYHASQIELLKMLGAKNLNDHFLFSKNQTITAFVGDMTVTKVGAMLRNHRLDEFPQVLNIISGSMSFGGTRPEAIKYVHKYKKEVYATPFLPAGLTSEASIHYKDESDLLNVADDVGKMYVETILPGKMKYNLESIRRFSFAGEIATMFRTVFAVLGKDYL